MSQDSVDSEDPLDYGLLLQDALRGVVRRCLSIVAREGLPGDHHFYLAFRTQAPGVEMPAHLRDQYPETMTIVLKTRFRDLSVGEDAFSVGLYFSGALCYLTIPFDALLAFTDPAAEFQLAFQDLPEDAEATAAEAEDAEATAAGAPAAGAPAGNVVAFPRRPSE